MKLGRDEVLMVPYKCCCFSTRSAQGRIQGGTEIGHVDPLLQMSFSLGRKATVTNRMHSNYLEQVEACGMNCCCFWFHSEVKFLTRSVYSGERHLPFGPLVYSNHIDICTKIYHPNFENNVSKIKETSGNWSQNSAVPTTFCDSLSQNRK